MVATLGGASPPSSPRLRFIRAALSEYRVDRFDKERQVARVLSLLRSSEGGAVTGSDVFAALAAQGILVDPAGTGAGAPSPEPEGSTPAPTASSSVGSALDPGLFGDDRVDRALLRERAFNFRWATLPEDVIALTAADSDFPVAVEIQEAMHAYIRGGYLNYGPAEGLPEFREASAARMRSRFGIPCSSREVLATNSAASALYLAVRCALEPGQEAIIADPVDFLLARSVAAAGGTLRRLPVSIGDEDLDLDAVEALITPGRTRLLSICNPHNPLGRVWSRARLEGLAELALRHDLWLVSDEVWGDIVFPPHTLTSLASLGPEVAARTFTVTGFSKNFALAGLRLGLLVCPSEAQLQRAVTLSHAHETADGVSTLSQIAGIAACRHGEPWLRRFLDHLQGNRDFALARLRAMPGVRCHAPQGTFVLFLDLSSYGRRAPSWWSTCARSTGWPWSQAPASSAPAPPATSASAPPPPRHPERGLDRLEAGLPPSVRGPARGDGFPMRGRETYTPQGQGCVGSGRETSMSRLGLSAWARRVEAAAIHPALAADPGQFAKARLYLWLCVTAGPALLAVILAWASLDGALFHGAIVAVGHTLTISAAFSLATAPPCACPRGSSPSSRCSS